MIKVMEVFKSNLCKSVEVQNCIVKDALKMSEFHALQIHWMTEDVPRNRKI